MDPALEQEREASTVDADLGFGGGGESPNSFSEQEDLKREMNEDMGAQNGQDPFDNEIGWDSPEQEEEEPVGEDTPEAEEETVEDDPEQEEEVETSEEDTDIDEGDEEDIETSDEEEAAEDEPFYDASRDFPDMDIDPTKYDNRVELNEGVAAKVQYLSELREELQQEGGNLGAIQLPEYFGNSEEFLEQPLDRNSFAEQDSDTAKKTAAELDQAIKRSRSKLNRVKEQNQRQQEVEQVSEEYKSAVTDLVQAVDAFDIDRREAERMRPQELLQQADQRLNELVEGEEGRRIIDDHGLAVYNQKVDQLKQHRQAIQKFPEAHQKHQKTQQESERRPQPEQVSPEQMDDDFEVFREDNPNLDMFNAPTIEPENAFKSFVKSKIIRDGFKYSGPRDFISLHNEYQKLLQKQSERYGKSKASKEKAKSPAKTKAGEKKADRSGKKKPPVHKVKGKGTKPGDRITTKDVDDELSDLKKEMNSLSR